MHLTNEAVAAYWDELEKIAGVREALRLLLTGKSSVRHGTTKTIAKKILEEGLQPQGTPGVSKLIAVPGEAGVAFTTRHPNFAKMYAAQARGIELSEKLRKLLPKGVKEKIRKRAVSAKMEEQLRAQGSPAKVEDMLQLQAGRLLANVPGGKKVVEARIPWKELHGMETPGRELHSPVMRQQRALLHQAHPDLENVSALPFITDVPVAGGVPARFIKGSPSYQHSTLRSIRQHIREAKKNPKEFGKELIRNYYGISHAPWTLLRQVPPSGGSVG